MHIRLIFLLFLLFLPLQAQGHKINVFAWVSGDTVTVESSFFGNNPMKKSLVTVKDNQTGEQILQGNGDENGIFHFPIPPALKQNATDLLIIVSGGDGHQAEWLLPASEYLVSKTTTQQHSPQSQQQVTDSEELKKMFQEVLEQELEPIKRSIAMANDRKPGFHEIMGGIGYLLGLAGLVAWLRNRKPTGRPTE